MFQKVSVSLIDVYRKFLKKFCCVQLYMIRFNSKFHIELWIGLEERPRHVKPVASDNTYIYISKLHMYLQDIIYYFMFNAL